MKINRLNESSSTAMKFKLVEPKDKKGELRVGKPTAVVLDVFSDEDYDSAKESNNGYSAEDLICVKAPKRRDENHDNSL